MAKKLLAGELPDCIADRDWYAFDVAAAQRYQDLLADSFHAKDPPPAQPHNPQGRHDPVAEAGNNLIIRGTEIPPWER